VEEDGDPEVGDDESEEVPVGLRTKEDDEDEVVVIETVDINEGRAVVVERKGNVTLDGDTTGGDEVSVDSESVEVVVGASLDAVSVGSESDWVCGGESMESVDDGSIIESSVVVVVGQSWKKQLSP